jgi:hypothetical protein
MKQAKEWGNTLPEEFGRILHQNLGQNWLISASLVAAADV